MSILQATLVFAITVAVSPIHLWAQSTPVSVLKEGFENGLGNWRASGNATATTTTTESKSGRYSVKMKLGPTDSVNYRTEIVPNSGGVFNVGTEYCIKANLKVKNWTSIPNWALIFQTHAVPGNENWNCVSGRNSISLTVRKDNQIGLHVIKQPRQNAGTSGAALADFAFSSPFSYNQWYNFTFRYRPSFSSDGIIEAWQDGKKIYQQFGGNVDLYDRCGKPAAPWTYLKVGLYKDSTNTGTQEIYYDDIEITKGTNACGAVASTPETPAETAGSTTFQNQSIPRQSKDFSAEIHVTPLNSKMDGVVSLSTEPMTSFDGGAIQVRMNTQGVFDVRNGGNYAFDSSVPYSAGLKYKIHVAANMKSKTYTVHVTSPDGKTTLLAKDYAFRSTQAAASSIGNLSTVSLTGQLKVNSFDIVSQSETPAGLIGTTAFQNQPFAPQSKDFSTEIEVTPLNQTMDGVVSLSTEPMTTFDGGAIQVRMSTQGVFDVRKGGAYAFDSSVPYSAGLKYKIHIAVNMTAKTYTVHVTSPDGKTTLLAKDYAFRSSQAAAPLIGNLGIVSLTGQFKINSANLISPILFTEP